MRAPGFSNFHTVGCCWGWSTRGILLWQAFLRLTVPPCSRGLLTARMWSFRVLGVWRLGFPTSAPAPGARRREPALLQRGQRQRAARRRRVRAQHPGFKRPERGGVRPPGQRACFGPGVQPQWRLPCAAAGRAAGARLIRLLPAATSWHGEISLASFHRCSGERRWVLAASVGVELICHRGCATVKMCLIGGRCERNTCQACQERLRVIACSTMMTQVARMCAGGVPG